MYFYLKLTYNIILVLGVQNSDSTLIYLTKCSAPQVYLTTSHCRPVIFNWFAPRIFKPCNPWPFIQGHVSLRLSNEEMTTANTTIAIQCEWISVIPICFVKFAKNMIHFLLCHRILEASLRVPWDEAGWKSLLWVVMTSLFALFPLLCVASLWVIL